MLVLWGPLALAMEGLTGFSLFDQGRKLAGLSGLSLLAVQFLLASRMVLVERGIGQDVLIRLHRLSGAAGLTAILAHAILDNLYRLIEWGTLVLSLPDDMPRVMGMVAAFTVVAIAVPAMFRETLRLRYGTWLRLHRISWLVFPSVLAHSMLAGSTIRYQPLAMVLWLFCAGIFVAVVAHRLVTSSRVRAHPFTVAKVENINPSVRSVTLTRVHTPTAGGRPKNRRTSALRPPVDESDRQDTFSPGQFVFVQVLHGGVWSDQHPFTISSSPGDPGYRISVKAVGDFTAKVVPALRTGTPVRVEGPYGNFLYTRFSVGHTLVFIAGGIGITPFISMVRHLASHEPGRTVRLVWGLRKASDLCFIGELTEALAVMPHFTVQLVFSDKTDGTGHAAADLATETPDSTHPVGSTGLSVAGASSTAPTATSRAANQTSPFAGYGPPRVTVSAGRIDAATLDLATTGSTWNTTGLMVCGPPSMMRTVRKLALAAGAPQSSVIMERFSL